MKKRIFLVKIRELILVTTRCFSKVEQKNLIFWIYKFLDVIFHFRRENREKKISADGPVQVW
jgi:hypothetical protein